MRERERERKIERYRDISNQAQEFFPTLTARFVLIKKPRH